MKRILAWIGILSIVLGFAALIYFVASGASANVIIAALFCMLVIPILIYAILMVAKLLNRENDSDQIS